MAEQLIERSGLHRLTAQPRGLLIALDQAALLQQPADALDYALHQRLQFACARGAHRPEHRRTAPIGHVHAIDEDHVKVHDG